jgi:hypothetical protein
MEKIVQILRNGKKNERGILAISKIVPTNKYKDEVHDNVYNCRLDWHLDDRPRRQA